MADWSILPIELLHLISEYLPTSIDVLRFRSVCATWRRAAPSPYAASRFPMLPNSGISDITWGFYLSKRTIYSLLSPLTDHSSWIIKLERDNPTRMHLLDPLARSQFKPLPITFPRFFSFYNIRVKELGEEYVLQYINFRPTANSIGEAGNLYMEKVALLNYSGGGFVLLTIHVSGKLVVYKSGGDKWKLIDDFPSPYDDVILMKGKFYAVDNTGRIVLVDTVNLKVTDLASSVFGGDKKFLVDSDGVLLLVDTYCSGASDLVAINEGGVYEEFDSFMSERTVKFKVFRLDEEARTWIEVTDLGDKILFLSDNCTFSASASEIFGDDDRCKGNCIFFVDQYCNWAEDGVWENHGIAVFDLGSKTIRPISDHVGCSKMFWPPPDWVYSTASVGDGLNLLNI